MRRVGKGRWGRSQASPETWGQRFSPLLILEGVHREWLRAWHFDQNPKSFLQPKRLYEICPSPHPLPPDLRPRCSALASAWDPPHELHISAEMSPPWKRHWPALPLGLLLCITLHSLLASCPHACLRSDVSPATLQAAVSRHLVASPLCPSPAPTPGTWLAQ